MIDYGVFDALARTLIEDTFGDDAVLVRLTGSTFDPITGQKSQANEQRIPVKTVLDARKLVVNGAFVGIQNIAELVVEPRIGDRLEMAGQTYIIDAVETDAPIGNAISHVAILRAGA